MGMRQRPTNGNIHNRTSAVRVMNKNQTVVRTKKKPIIPIISLAVMVIFGIICIVAAIVVKNDEKSAPMQTAEKTYFTQIDNFLNLTNGMFVSGTLEGMDLSPYVDETCTPLLSQYSTYYIDACVAKDAYIVDIYGMTAEGEQQYVTSVINKKDGTFIRAEGLYKQCAGYEKIAQPEDVFTYLLGSTKYVKVNDSGLRSGSELYQYYRTLLEQIQKSKAYELAKTEDTFSFKIPHDKLPKIETTCSIATVLASNEEDLVSTYSVDETGKNFTIGFQKGAVVFKGTISEYVQILNYNRLNYASKERLTNSIVSFNNIITSVGNKEAEEAAKAAAEEAKKELEKNQEKEGSDSEESTTENIADLEE